MSTRFWPKAWRAAVPLAALASILSCQNTTIVEEEASATAGDHYVHFRVADSSTIPDSLWYKSPMDSGGHSFMVEGADLTVRFWPFLNQLGDKDTLAIHTYRLGLHLGITITKSAGYMDLLGVRTVRSGADSLVVGLLHSYDSLRKAVPESFKDTSASGKKAAFQQVVAELVFRGHPGTAAYARLAPVGLDTAKVNRQILTLAAQSGLTLGEVVRRWNFAMDYSTARKALAALSEDTSSLNPFRLEAALRLDTLRLGESPVGLVGKVSGKKGIATVKFSIENDSGDRTDRFVLADAPDPKNHPGMLDLASHPTFQPRQGTALGKYTLRVEVRDSLSNAQNYSTNFVVAPALDHSGPALTVLAPTGSVVRDFNDSMLTVKVEAKDASGVQWVKIGGNEAKKDSVGNWWFDLVVPVSATSQNIAIQAKDAAGNTSDAQIQIRRNEAPKPTAPRLTLIAPANNTMVSFDSTGVWVEWKAQTDFGKIEGVTIDGKAAKQEGGVWRLWVELPPDGKLVNLPVRAQSSVPLSVTEFVAVGRRVDSAGPAVRWDSPSQGHRVAYDIKTLDVRVSVADPSGLDSVRIDGKKPDTAGGFWKTTVDLGNPGELTRIHVKAWDHLKNETDSVLLVSRDPIPGQLPPRYRWVNPDKSSGTIIPFAETSYLVQCVLTDISGVESSSVLINGVLATPVNDSLWERRVDLPPDGKAQTITLEAKNKRGVSISGFVSVARAADAEKPTFTRWTATKDLSVLFDTTSVEVGWTAKDNDRIAKAWIQDSLVTADATGYHLRVGLAVATQWIKFRAMDPAGNEVRDSVSVERRTDTVKAVALSDTNGKLRSGAFWVKLSCATPGATIRYTLDGSEPKATSAIFADSIKIDTTITLKARGFAAGRVDGPVVVQGYQMAVPMKLFSGMYHTLVIMSDSSLWGYGLNNCNAIGGSSGCVSSPMAQAVPRKLAEGVVEAGTSNTQSYWVKTDGTLWAIGTNTLGSLGVGVLGPILDPTIVTRGVAKVRSFERSVTSVSLLVLKTDGSLWGAGSNSSGQIGLGALGSTSQLVKIADSVSDMGGGASFGYFTKWNGTFWMMGVFDSIGLNSKNPVKILDSISLIPSGSFKSLIVRHMSGKYLGCGENAYGQLGLGSTDPVRGWKEIQPLFGKEVSSIKMTSSHSIFLTKNGDAFGVGSNEDGEIMGNISENRYLSLTLAQKEVIAIGAGEYYSSFLRKDGTLLSVGANKNGQLGGGVVSRDPQVVQVRF
ncbi:MAG: chitobiase/beta-hexosaminidase C-terminal domain-containing protein [Fibrobacterota bacterium]|nr:chitobiase/beta-hexosaminidase C-terminal domain-containing protein [Fibrobacterota bacterium]QQS06784.1 MAG: chitobiase/beta-hexosaminidase C-terminal domain-containing protein [Fibrobacterota bacterium]